MIPHQSARPAAPPRRGWARPTRSPPPGGRGLRAPEIFRRGAEGGAREREREVQRERERERERGEGGEGGERGGEGRLLLFLLL